jgi:hypothetical protein
MTVRFSASTGFGKDRITSGRGFSTVTGGRGKPKTEHDP